MPVPWRLYGVVLAAIFITIARGQTDWTPCNGEWDPTTQTCVCNSYWTGTNCSVCARGVEVTCQNGYYDCYTYRCICDPGWTGINCSMCSNSSSCGPHGVCDTTFTTYSSKTLTCHTGGLYHVVFANGTASFTSYFAEPNITSPNNYATFQLWDENYGPPEVFGCTLYNCGQQVYENGTIIYSCSDQSCNLCGPHWQPCPIFVISFIEGMKGAQLVCTQNTTMCYLYSNGMKIELPDCTAAECIDEGTPPIPFTPAPAPPKISENESIILIASGVGVFVLGLIALIVYYQIQKRAEWDSVTLASAQSNSVAAPVDMMHTFKCDISFHNLTYTIGSAKQAAILLDQCSGVCRAGTLTAVMGPSGAGKTTLLDILASRKAGLGKVKGDVLVNGMPPLESFRRRVSYVLQEDALMPTLTVRESLMYAAELRLPTTMSRAQKMARVLSVIRELGLEKVANSRIGNDDNRGISGGERKRVAIGCELVTSPSVIILDEPTSGLDSFNALSLVKNLAKVAARGRTVIMSIHQPRHNIFTLLDTLILLSNGKVLYNGPASRALSHFEALGHSPTDESSPADFLIDLISASTPETLGTLATRYRESYAFADLQSDLASVRGGRSKMVSLPTPGAVVKRRGNSAQPEDTEKTPLKFASEVAQANVQVGPSLGEPLDTFASPSIDWMSGDDSSSYATPFYHQLWVLGRRATVNALRNPFLLRAHVITSIVLGVLIGLIYFKVQNSEAGVQNRGGVFFFLVALLSFASLSALEVFVSERSLFVRERATKSYRTSAYFFARTLTDLLPLRIIPPLIMGSIVYYMVGLQPAISNFLIFLLVLVLANVVATTLCLAIGAVVPTVAAGNLIAVLWMLFCMLFGGFLVNKSTIPPAFMWVRYISFFDYAFESLMDNELNTLYVDFNPTVNGESFQIFLEGTVILQNLALDPNAMWRDIYSLMIMAGGFLLLAYCALRWCVRERR